MSESERLEYIIGELCAGNQAQFARLTGINGTAINKILNGKGEEIGIRLSDTYINRIVRAFPMVNPSYLKGESDYPGELSISSVKAEYEKRLEERDRTIDILRKELDLQRRMLEKLL